MLPAQSDKNHLWWMAVAILLLTIVTYIRAYNAGFVTDFTGLYVKMQGQGLRAALNSFGFPSLMPLLNVAYWLLYKIFGLHAMGWFLFAVVCSSLTLLIFYRLSRLLLVDFGYAHLKATITAFAACALVFTSPYQVEAMIWKVGLGHLMSVFLFVSSFYLLVQYLRMKVTKYLIASLVVLMLSLFCFEWGLVFPGMATVLVVGYWRIGKLSIKEASYTFAFTLIPVLIYLGLTKLVLGSWLGHYDTETEMQLSVMTMASTTLKYFIKHLGFVHFYPHELKQSVYAFADSAWPVVSFIGAMIMMALLGIVKGKKSTLRGMSLAWAILGLVLVSGLHFHTLMLSENDRYGSLFIYFLALMVALIIAELPRWIGYGLLVLILMAQIFFQQRLVSQWSRSQNQIEKITTSFQRLDLQESDKVLMLNLPENLNGTFMFRDFSGGNPVGDHLNMYGIAYPQMDLVAQYNVPFDGQAYSAKWIGKGRIRLEAKEWGSWWWRHGMGAGKYESDDYKFEPKSKAMEVQLKDGHTYTKIIYFNGAGWELI